MRIIAYDTSLVNLGYAYGSIVGGKLVVERAGTFQPDKFIKATGMFDFDDTTTSRQYAVAHFVKISTEAYCPIGIVGETSFYNGSNPSTLINQSKGLGLLEKLTHGYLLSTRSPFEPLFLQPNVIKRDLGLDKTEFKDKTKIDEYIYKHIESGDITYLSDDDLPENQLDHANDAVAMLYGLYLRILRLDMIE